MHWDSGSRRKAGDDRLVARPAPEGCQCARRVKGVASVRGGADNPSAAAVPARRWPAPPPPGRVRVSTHRLVLLLLVPFTVHAQPLGSADALPRPTGAALRSSAVAIRLTASPPLDARDDTPVWRSAQLIEGFRQFQPIEDGEERFRTEARVAYDAKYLYVMVRAFDPHPDSIASLLSRRDVRTPSDQIKIMIDSYHDRRTGYEFAVNRSA